MHCKHFVSGLLAATLLTGVAHASTVTVNGGGSSLAYPTYVADFAAYSTAESNKQLFSYEAVGSGAGQNAFLKNSISYFQPISTSNPNGYAAGTLTYGKIVGTEVDFGASDAFLSATQLTNAATGSYGTATEGSAVDGPLIQIPTLGTPITIPFNESGVTSGLTLTDTQLCGVLSGKITDWHSLVSTIPAGTTIQVVYRSDSSGTSFLLTNHLAAVCTTSNSKVTFTAQKVFASEFPSSTPPANFTGASGSGGVAKALLATSNSFGYLSPDYTSIAPGSANTTSLQVASVVNASDKTAYAPTVANTTTGLKDPGTGATNGTPPSTLAQAQNPLNWVPSIPVTKHGYPIVGYTTVDISSCYSNATRGKIILTILKDILPSSGSYATIATNNGFVTLQASGASKFYTAVKADFLSNTSGFNLDIDDATTCAAYSGR